jgi:decaprenylphospho-beta-D-erythro-pentofuranosid-2-ulose 2-reductase
MNPAILILGASSSIARSSAFAFASKGYSLYLAGRDLLDLERIAADIKVRYGVEAYYGYFDAEDFDSHEKFVQKVVSEMPRLHGVLLAFGTYQDQRKAAVDFKYAHKIIDINYTGACSILTWCGNYLGAKGTGFIIAISSVAGDRGRQSNYIYGSAKGGLTLFLQGLRNRLFHAGVRVITIKPGFVDTAMTFGVPKMFLVASPKDIGEKIAASINKKRDVIYLPWFWRFIMDIIKLIPERLFKRLKL